MNFDQIIVRVGKACNFKCNFCNVSANETHVQLKEAVEDIVRNFHYKFKYSDVSSGKILITISGGEPSIFQRETLFALKYITKFLEKREIQAFFDIQTNASEITAEFASNLKKHGVHNALVSFHMSDPKIFEAVIGLPFEPNFAKIGEGIHHLHNAGINVETNTILSNQNKDNYLETLKYIGDNFPFIHDYSIGMIQPHGEAEKNLETVIPDYEATAPIYNEAITYLKSEGKTVLSHFVGLPACYLEHHENSLEIQDNLIFRKNFKFDSQYLIADINDTNKTQTSDCKSCVYNNICSGIWKEYEGIQKLKPLEYIIDRNNDFKENEFAYKLQSKGEDLNTILDRNIKQIIILSSLGDTYTLLSSATKIGFYKVSLLIDDDFELSEQILQTGVGNIQVHRKNISDTMIQTIQNFSAKYAPQFTIDIDFLDS